MRICDWSTDVCSSVLQWLCRHPPAARKPACDPQHLAFQRRPRRTAQALQPSDRRDQRRCSAQVGFGIRVRRHLRSLPHPGGILIMSVIARLKKGAVAGGVALAATVAFARSEEHTSELQSLMRISYAVFCLKKKTIEEPDSTKMKSIY